MRKLIQLIIGVLLCLSGSLLLCGQEATFWNLTMEDGLSFSSTSRTFPMLQDSRGFMWIASNDGLNRFDGRQFRVFRMRSEKEKSLSNNFVNALCEDPDGNIWIGTTKGISVFDPQTETFTHFYHDPQDPKSLNGESVNFVSRDLEGNIWVGTRFSKVCHYSWKFKHFIPHSLGSISNGNGVYHYGGDYFHQQKDGSIWIANSRGLNLVEVEKDSFINYPAYPQTDSWRFNAVVNFAEDRNGVFWLASGTPFGRRVFDTKTRSFREFPAELLLDKDLAIHSFLEDRKGNIWIGTSEGAIKWDPVKRQSWQYRHDDKDPASILPGIISNIFEDREGNIWFLVTGSGLSVLHTLPNPFEACTNFPVQAIARLDQDRVFLGTANGVNVYDLRQKKVVSYEFPAPIRSSDVLFLTTTRHQELWVADQRIGSTFAYSLTDKKVLYESRRANPLTEDRDGNLWTSHILYRYDREMEKWENVYEALRKKDPRNAVTAADFKAIATDSSGNIWIGTDGNGLYKYDHKQEALYTGLRGLEPLRKLNDAIINGLYVGSNGWIYASTSYGLSIYDPVQEKLHILGESSGLLHNQIKAIAEDHQGHIWLATARGISRLDISSWWITNFNKDNGLYNNHFIENVSYVDAEGYLYFSTERELLRFHPDSLMTEGSVAPVYLTSFFVNRQLVEPGGPDSILQAAIWNTKSVVLSYKNANFGFEFVMPIFKNSGNVRYFYQLEGYENSWNQARDNQNEAYYTNINPGTYTFRVKAMNGDGNPGMSEARLVLIITPPWWATWWAYLLYFLAALSLVYILFNRQQLKYRLNLETLEAEKLKEVDQMKSRFFANISHEFRTPLTMILGQVDMLKATINDQRQRGKLLVADRNAKRLLELVNQLLDLSKLEAGAMTIRAEESDLVAFVKNIFYSIGPLAEKKKLSLYFRTEPDQLQVYFDPDKLEKIISNLISNAWKFTPEGGAISLSIEETDQDWVTINLSDTGQGIPDAALPYLFDRFYQVDGSYTRRQEGTGIGLALVKELVELHHGTVSVQSRLGEGSVFSVRLRRGRAHFRDAEIAAEQIDQEREAPLTPTGLLPEENPLPTFGEIGQADAIPGGASVLVVEDNPDVRAFIVESLRERQYDVLEAADGKEGLKKAREVLPDLIITDVMMPEMDGYEFSRQVRAEITTSHIPIIILTAKTEEEEKIYGLRIGVDDYLTKPFSLRELLVRVSNLITLRQQLRRRFSRAAVIDPSEVSTTSMDQVFLKSVMQTIEKQLGDQGFGVEQLARELHISVSHLNRKLKALIDQPAGQLIRSRRLHRAAELLVKQAGTVTEIAFQFGFSDASNFSRSFKQQFGCSPSEYMEKYESENAE